jgi:hypothetical protein|tara:strand:+ start:1236 stop:1718 length:483 start_codon:yes stop_codon:yes gene_type:complete
MGRDSLKQLSLFENVVLLEEDKTRECRICKEVKPDKSFHIKTPLSNNTGILDRTCNECNRIKNREQTKRRHESVKPSDDYRCPICKRNQEEILNHTIVVDKDTHERVERRYKKVWVVDHNHSTGKFRGIICNPCNIKLGQFQDDINNFKNAIKYLEETNE